jgi:hypothetical protein
MYGRFRSGWPVADIEMMRPEMGSSESSRMTRTACATRGCTTPTPWDQDRLKEAAALARPPPAQPGRRL